MAEPAVIASIPQQLGRRTTIVIWAQQNHHAPQISLNVFGFSPIFWDPSFALHIQQAQYVLGAALLTGQGIEKVGPGRIRAKVGITV